MPLQIILPIVVFGIAGIVWLVHSSGWTVHRRIHDLADAQALWQADFPDEGLSKLRCDDENRVALVWLLDGRMGLIWSFGDDVVARHLDRPPVVQATSSGLALGLNDYTAPRVDVTLADHATRTEWAKTLNAIEKAA